MKGQDDFMANFTVRVELHEVNMREPSGDDYERLHLAMQRRQYFRVIRGSDDTWYHLPHAEYTVTWQATIADVLAEVASITKSVWDRAGVFVTESKGRRWKGLKIAKASEADQLTRTDV
jgi:hypothetical protein